MTEIDWLSEAQEFYAAKDWVGALSSARNALRHNVRNLAAWHLGCDTQIAQGRQDKARRFAKALSRFAKEKGDHAELQYANARIAEFDKYFATLHRRVGETDLTHAVGKGELPKVRELIEAGANVNEPNRTQWTPLHVAALRGKPDLIELLVEHGANLEALDTLDETPLITACRFGNQPVVPVLLRLCARVAHVAKEKHTALWYAISSMKNIEIVKLLITAGADANETYAYGDNPFLLSLSAENTAVTDFLLPLTHDLARMNQHELCAIRLAAGGNNTKLIRILLERGVDVNQPTSYGHTPLMSAAEENAVAAAKLLLESGADPLQKSEYGDTAISLAEQRRNAEVYKVLTHGRELEQRRD